MNYCNLVWNAMTKRINWNGTEIKRLKSMSNIISYRKKPLNNLIIILHNIISKNIKLIIKIYML